MKNYLVTYTDDDMKRKIYLIKRESTFMLREFVITKM